MNIKVSLIILSLLIMNCLNVNAEGCSTGYACSIKDLKNQEKQKNEDNSKNENEKNTKHDEKDKNEGIFVDGGKYNSPYYTETFTLFDYLQ